LTDYLNGTHCGQYVPIEIKRIVDISKDKAGATVNFEELLLDGQKSGYVRCASSKCQKRMNERKIKIVSIS